MPANQQSFSNWGGGYDPNGQTVMPIMGPMPSFRSAKDRTLAAWGSTPEASYPDGYLGTITNRRQDKIVNAVNRTNQRQYSRGVHKGERINPGDYIWPDEFNLNTGLARQLKGKKRFTPPGALPVQLTNDGKPGPQDVARGIERPKQEVIDLQRRSMLKNLAPSWK